MPTATRVSGFEITNFGPLTSTFTPAPACATSTQILDLAYSGSPTLLAYNIQCAVPTVNSACFPSESQLDARVSIVWNDPGNSFLGYFSPGLACPSGWTTAGVAAKDGDGKVAITSGIFERPKEADATTMSSETQQAFFNPQMNVLTAVIDAGETVAVCCPSSMTADIYGDCLSVLSDYKPTSGCSRSAPTGAVGTVTTDFTYFGSHTTAALLTISPGYPVVTQALTSVDRSRFQGVSIAPMAILIHKSGDVAGGGGSSSSGGSGPASTAAGQGGGGQNPSQPNAAGSGRGGGGNLALLASICAVAMSAAFVLAL